MTLRKTISCSALVISLCGGVALGSGWDVDSLIEYVSGESRKVNYYGAAVGARRLLRLGGEHVLGARRPQPGYMVFRRYSAQRSGTLAGADANCVGCVRDIE